ncbi:MAG: hypothetical protein AABY80_08045, partial [Candidatus Deferrimicrobiota bacterium]
MKQREKSQERPGEAFSVLFRKGDAGSPEQEEREPRNEMNKISLFREEIHRRRPISTAFSSIEPFGIRPGGACLRPLKPAQYSYRRIIPFSLIIFYIGMWTDVDGNLFRIPEIEVYYPAIGNLQAGERSPDE